MKSISKEEKEKIGSQKDKPEKGMPWKPDADLRVRLKEAKEQSPEKEQS